MKQKKAMLGASERILLELLWEKSPQTVTELYHKLHEMQGWSKSTVNTMLSRMMEKEFLRFEQGKKAKEYYPAVNQEEINLAETEHFIDRVYQGSVGLMMSTLMRQKKIDKKELRELYKMLEGVEEDD